jgi:hypothetical protein
MAFVVGNHVWFKAAGSTPFVRGDASDPALAVGASLGGRGKADVSLSAAAQSGLSDNQGVPTIQFNDFPAAHDSTDTVDDGDNTFPAAGEHLGVRDQVTDNNPLAPGSVATDGVFDGPTSERLSGLGTVDSGEDEGDVSAPDDTIRDIDPNFPTGRSNAVAASGGASSPIGGTQDFVSEIIDQKGSAAVGNRLPSSEEGPGVVIEVVTVKSAGISVDGTKLVVGDKQYWVDWGSSAVSNPHRSKLNNRMRTTLHAEADLVAA